MNKVKHNCDNINCNHNDTKGLCCLFNSENCKYRQLQKENAELKETVIKMNNVITETFSNLTKAKELLKQWVELYKPKLEGYPITPIQEQTEQFISEVEK